MSDNVEKRATKILFYYSCWTIKQILCHSFSPTLSDFKLPSFFKTQNKRQQYEILVSDKVDKRVTKNLFYDSCLIIERES